MIRPKEVKKVVISDTALLRKAARYEGNSNVDKAIELYDEFLQEHPDSSLVLLARALISLADSPTDDLNIELFQEYFDKGLKASAPDKIESLLFLMYQFVKYTIPLVCVWQVYAYKKRYDLDSKAARARMSNNLQLLFSVQQKITDLFDSAKFLKVTDLSNSEIETYEDFVSGIIKFDTDLLEHYNPLYKLYLDTYEIKRALRKVKWNYTKFKWRH